MPPVKEECHGQACTLARSSGSFLCPSRIRKFMWHLFNGGMRQALRTTSVRIQRFLETSKSASTRSVDGRTRQEVLAVEPGEWVRVRSRDEIHAMLDSCQRNEGLAWMPMMEDCCGKEFRVYKRVERIVLESTGEIRKLKDTVLLEDAICDGIYGCNRSCFFFWKEAWLERVVHHN